MDLMRRRVEVQIGGLVIDGFDSGDSVAVLDGIQLAIEETLVEHGRWSGGIAGLTADTPGVDEIVVTSGRAARDIGRALAAAVVRALPVDTADSRPLDAIEPELREDR
jgi:hypothetical protein